MSAINDINNSSLLKRGWRALVNNASSAARFLGVGAKSASDAIHKQKPSRLAIALGIAGGVAVMLLLLLQLLLQWVLRLFLLRQLCL
jgi:hypothetical protein